MSLIKYTVLICDCDQVMIDGKQLAFTCNDEITDVDATTARKKAKGKGWTFAPHGKRTKLDVCYKHSKMIEAQQVEIDKRDIDPIFSHLRQTTAPSNSELKHMEG